MNKIFFLILLFFLSIFSFSFNSFAAEKKEKTEITGDKMEIKNKGKVSVFKGNAKVVRGNYNITANEMKYYKDKNEIDAKGKVNFFVKNDDGSIIKAKSSKAKYNTKNMSGKMWSGKPKVEYFVKGSTDSIVLYMDKLFLRENFASAKAVGHVKIISSSGTITSDNALLKKNENSLFMTKEKNKPNVNVWQKGKKANFKADEISLLYNDKTVKMNKNVEGKVIFDNLEVEQ